MAILAIARKLGSGSYEIGLAVKQALSYDFVDKKRIYDFVDKKRAQEATRVAGERRAQLGVSFNEGYPGIIARYDASFIGFIALVEYIVLEQALKDNVIIIGRGTNFVLKGVPYALRLRVTAPLEQRIERVTKRDNVTREVAEMLIKRADFEMSRAIKYLYGKGWDDPAQYDVVVDTGKETISQIAEKLVVQLKENDALRTEEAKKQLALKTKAYEIRAGLLTNPKVVMPVLDVHVQGEGLLLKGVAKNTDVADLAEEIARRIARDTPLKVEIYSD